MKLILQYLAEASQKAAGTGTGEGQSIEQLILQVRSLLVGKMIRSGRPIQSLKVLEMPKRCGITIQVVSASGQH